MADKINWLHLTDLHFGLDSHGWLWPNIKRSFFKDLEVLTKKVGQWDLVLFTGDFVQQGSADEYNRLTKELQELWEEFRRQGSNPLLCAIPGNHDIQRPPPNSAAVRALTKHWADDTSVQRTFWEHEHNEYREIVAKAFAPYLDWLKRSEIPKVEMRPGILPGDFSAVFSKDAIRLGIIGLNSTSLQLAPGDFSQSLTMHVSQINAVCDPSVDRWLSANTANILLTHQPPNWLSPSDLAHFRGEIHPPGRFISHFCGHMHDAAATDVGEAGAAPRRLRQAASLFGLEKWDELDPKTRMHGFTAGQFLFDEDVCIERLWPRTTVLKQHGALGICPNHAFELRSGDDCTVTTIALSEDKETASTGDAKETGLVNPTLTQGSIGAEVSILEPANNESEARRKLVSCTRWASAILRPHLYVRQEEQSQFEAVLRKSRAVWLIADWGVGHVEFVSACLDRFRRSSPGIDVFHLRCDDVDSAESFESQFPQQFGMPMATFCSIVGSLPAPFLILTDIPRKITCAPALAIFEQLAQAILDYSPTLKLILSAASTHEPGILESVTISALDVPDVRSFVANHPDASADLQDPETVEKLYERSEGIPRHLDRMIQALRVSSLAAVLEAEMEGFSTVLGTDTVPKALVQAVISIRDSGEKISRRSFRLLKVLSLLSYGETIESIRHFFPAEPFFLDNALELERLGLIDVIPLLQVGHRVGALGSAPLDRDAPKILKVPRLVRDFTLTLIDDDEKAEIVSSGLESYFSRGWRWGKVKLRKPPSEYSHYLGSGAGNEFALLHHLMAASRAQGDRTTLAKGARLGIHYCRWLESHDRYRDVTLVAGALIQLLDASAQTDEWCDLALALGEGLRMHGRSEEGIRFTRDAISHGNKYLQNETKASAWLTIALAERTLGHVDGTKTAAEEVLKLASQNSATHLHAEAIIAKIELSEEEFGSKLKALGQRASSAGQDSLAHTLALEQAAGIDNTSEKIKIYDSILLNHGFGYNQVRAIVNKTITAQLTQNDLIKGEDLQRLAKAYSYLYGQRMGTLFDTCHGALWEALRRRNDTQQMMRLFRHSSFVWRIRGQATKEVTFLKQLNERSDSKSIEQSNSVLPELRYFLGRIKVLLIG